MQSEKAMNRLVLKSLLLLVVVSVTYAGISGSAEEAKAPASVTKQEKKTYEPAGKFVPTEKLRADDAVAFPVDI